MSFTESSEPARKSKPGWKGKEKHPNRITGRAWMAIRKRILRRDYICRMCIKKGKVNRDSVSTIVDHIVNLESGGSNEDNNLQGLCEPCHTEKTNMEARKGRDDWRKSKGMKVSKPVDEDGWPIE